jgi:hypothetical protein
MADRGLGRDFAAVPVFAVCLLALIISLTQVFAGEADVVAVDVRHEGGAGAWRLDVSVKHSDEGWDHYADKWDVTGVDGTVYGERVLLHPHVGEQPFTRSQSGIRIPDSVAEIVVRAHDSVHGYGGVEITVDLNTLR